MEIKIHGTVRDYIRHKSSDNSITLELVERPGGV